MSLLDLVMNCYLCQQNKASKSYTFIYSPTSQKTDIENGSLAEIQLIYFNIIYGGQYKAKSNITFNGHLLQYVISR